MNLPFFVAGCLFLVMVLRYAYLPWFQPEKYILRSRKFRRKYREKSNIKNPGVILFGFFERNPNFELIAVRIVSIIMVLAAIISIFVAIRGPFIIN
jgi:hypothetical protein